MDTVNFTKQAYQTEKLPADELIKERITPSQIPISPVDFPRTDNAKKIWDEIGKAIKDELSISVKGTLDSTLKDNTLRVEKGFIFTADKNDSEFSRFQVEPLIDQAADLLDRCLRERARWDDISEKAIKLWLELSEYYELDEIHQREEQSGIYDVDYIQSSSNSQAEQESHTRNEINMEYANKVLSKYFSLEAMNDVNGWNQLSSWLQGLVLYSFGEAGFNGYLEHTFNDIKRTPSDHFLTATFNQTVHALNTQRSSLIFQREVFGDLSAISELKATGAEARADWEEKNRNFRKERTLVSRRHQDLKAKAATDPDGVLNHVKRLGAIKKRFQSDFRDALARINVASVGIREIYGYDTPLPTAVGNVDYYDECLQWIRDAIQWLNRFSTREQSTIYPLSLRSLLGDDMWKQDYGDWTIPVDKELFPYFCNVRLRGLAAEVKDNIRAKDRTWQLYARPPVESKIEHIDGKIVSLDQSEIMPCVLGRVSYVGDQREPDIVGMTALHNSSPFGDWNIKILGATPPKKDRDISGLNDILIHLYISYRYRDLGNI